MRPHPTGALAMNRREILSLASALVLAQSSEAAQPTASS
jgi:hypothetical protein